MKILVTGGAGYIGSHTAYELIKAGHEVTILDSLIKGSQSTLDKIREAAGNFEFLQTDLRDLKAVRNDLQGKKFDATIHFAAFIEVGYSTKYPELFFENNVVGSQNLFQVLLENNNTNLVFSSSAAVYGTPDKAPIPEDATKRPESPYGQTKYLMEQMLETYCKYRGFNAVSLRYFNPAGSYVGINGEKHLPETHLIPLLLHAFLDESFTFSIYGDDYSTPDGTAIRDFIHMKDLVDAHIKSIDYLKQNPGHSIFNVGTGQGTSVRDVVTLAQEVVGRHLNYKVVERRAGDPAILVADPAKIGEFMGWKAKYSLKDILISAWEWEKERDQGDYHKKEFLPGLS